MRSVPPTPQEARVGAGGSPEATPPRGHHPKRPRWILLQDRMPDGFISHCFCNKFPKIQWLKITQIYHQQLCRSEVGSQSQWAKIKVSSGLCQFWKLQEGCVSLPSLTFGSHSHSLACSLVLHLQSHCMISSNLFLSDSDTFVSLNKALLPESTQIIRMIFPSQSH